MPRFIANAFVHLLPDLEEASRAFVQVTAGQALWFAESHVYLVSLAGFVLFYGLEHMIAPSRRSLSVESDGAGDRLVFLLHVGGFAVWQNLRGPI